MLDSKRSWVVDDAGGDYDVFYSEFILHLRELKYAGFFEELSEIERNQRGRKNIARARPPSLKLALQNNKCPSCRPTLRRFGQSIRAWHAG